MAKAEDKLTRVSVNITGFVDYWVKAPREVVYVMRGMIGRMFGHHRKVLRQHVGTPGLRRLIGTGDPDIRGRAWARWYAEPWPSIRTQSARRRESQRGAIVKLDDVWGQLRMRSKAEIAQEFGPRVVPKKKKLLAVPAFQPRRGKGQSAQMARRIAVGALTPGEYRSRGLKPELRYVPVKNKKRGKGAVAMLQIPTTTKTGRQRMKTLWLLYPVVQLKPLLNVLASWRADEGYRRNTIIPDAAAELSREMARALGEEVRKKARSQRVTAVVA